MNFQFEEHPGEEALELYSLGRVGETDTEIIEEHLLICEGCRVRLDHTDRYVRAMQAAAVSVRAEREHQSSARDGVWDWMRGLALPSPAMALTAAAVCAVLIMWGIPRTHPAPDPGLFTVALISQRGESSAAPSYRRLDLQMDARGLALGPQVRVDIVNASGKTIERATVPDHADRVEVRTAHALAPGSYYVRLFPPGSARCVREFSLELK